MNFQLIAGAYDVVLRHLNVRDRRKGTRHSLKKIVAKGLERSRVRRLAGLLLPDSWADAVADAIAAKKAGTAKGNPLTVAVYPEITREEFLAMRAAEAGAVKGNPLTDGQRESLGGLQGNPLTDRQRKSFDKSEGLKSEKE